ncbi:type-2 restriction enzyme AvaI [Candidatus Vecturithrix granuli]|uniref:Type-2 restriction enzyme AvaI n=1 Tax=Vecturithrix granuli TaxID=1499967 RepID=A0A081C633_VECG1|nr:type-2 restriction enzyme AvaI [Candidatus Vecturithrix granuli]
MSEQPAYTSHISSSDSLVTPYAAIRAGFVALALEKNRKATPFVAEARALQVSASQANTPQELLEMESIKASLLTAAGVSDKAANHLTEADQKETIQGLIDNFLEPAGKEFVEELVYRFLLTRGDTLGGSMRNLAGALGERKLTRAIISTLSIAGRPYSWLHSKTMQWLPMSDDDTDIEFNLRGLQWSYQHQPRTFVYNLTVPLVKKNVDLCLFHCEPEDMVFGKQKDSIHYKPEKYLALGELKGGIDPAGADEHWKTANSALQRIRTGFAKKSLTPYTFFIGAAIEKSMAKEIFHQLENRTLTNAANLTNEEQLISICKWLIQL